MAICYATLLWQELTDMETLLVLSGILGRDYEGRAHLKKEHGQYISFLGLLHHITTTGYIQIKN